MSHVEDEVLRWEATEPNAGLLTAMRFFYTLQQRVDEMSEI